MPPMISGSKTNDFGFYMFDKLEKEELISEYPQAESLLHIFVGAAEFIKGETWYCLYISEKNKNIAYSIPVIAKRLDKVKTERSKSKLDDIVESCYPDYPFASDEARLECLFKLYEKMTAAKK